MKATLFVCALVASGFFGWSLKPTTQPSYAHSPKPVGLTPSSTAHDQKQLHHTGDVMFREVVKSSFWIRTEQGGRIATKHAFVSVYENPPMSGKFFVGQVVIFDRPDLNGILQEEVRHGVQNVRAWVEVRGQGSNRTPVLVAQTGDRNRIITIPIDQFPTTATELVRLVLPYGELLGSGE